ncbi:hypothetical protein [Psychromonas antarctica]|jgi:glucan phosphoethanolaminetransferase (alkaline phosphatase superfamily)|uniref:hypothetical protein n=1 Tax=Psychromonas antarctica TaxID=67573 RepID=UPI001EE98BE6|nr:hypothetical protein [Psychromonas antarctica]MCG6200614.1 hypothetical protein [Psychromonas antarctica]
MEQQYVRQHFHNAHEWRRFFLLWLTVFLWAAFLGYMLLFHYARDFFEPLVMSYFEVDSPQYYQFSEIRIFMSLLWACSIISVLAILNTWNKKRRQGDNTPDKFLIVIMSATVVFAFYYAKTDLNYLNGQLSILATLFGE